MSALGERAMWTRTQRSWRALGLNANPNVGALILRIGFFGYIVR